jgi:membrane protease YdiL (CAAX protease family)
MTRACLLSAENISESAGRSARWRAVLLWSLLLYGSWALTWLAYVSLARGPLPMLREPSAATAWWMCAKLLVWIAPVVVILRSWRVGSVAGWLGLDRPSGLLRGCGLAAAWVAGSALIDYAIPGRWPVPVRADSGIAWSVLLTAVAALAEEILYRGFALRALAESGLGFWRANAVAAVLFALLHVPGWLFMGRSLSACADLLPGIMLCGFVFGAARVRNASLWPSVLVHGANNLWSGGLLLSIARELAS